MTEQFQGLLPIGERVTHFDGGPGTHGKGTIVAYNGRQPSGYLKERFSEAVEIAGKANLMDGLVESFYDGVRCPYVIRWDSSDQYPQGYRDVYEQASVNRLEPAENIFIVNGEEYPEGTRLTRRWCSGDRGWTTWQVISEDEFEKRKEDSSFEFCQKPRTEVSEVTDKKVAGFRRGELISPATSANGEKETVSGYDRYVATMIQQSQGSDE